MVDLWSPSNLSLSSSGNSQAHGHLSHVNEEVVTTSPLQRKELTDVGFELGCRGYAGLHKDADIFIRVMILFILLRRSVNGYH